MNGRCKVNENSFGASLPLMKKNTLLLIVAAVVALIAAVYFFFLRPVNVFVAIPDSAILVVQVDDWKTFNQKLAGTPTGASLKKTELAVRLEKEMKTMEQFFAGDESLKNILGSGKTIASVHLVSAGDYDFLFTTSVKGFSDSKLLEYVQSLKGIKVNVRAYKRQKVVDVVLADGSLVTFAKQRGILSFSFTPFLAENSVAAIVSGRNIESEKSFRKALRKLPDNTGLNLFINFKKAAVLLPVTIREEKMPLLADISAFAEWGAYSIAFTGSDVKINGTAVSASEKQEVVTDKNIFKSELFNKIPDNAAYVHISLNNPSATVKRFTNYRNWIGEARALVVLEPLKQDFEEQSAFVLQVKDAALALKDLKNTIVSTGGSQAPIDTHMDMPIYNLKDGNILNSIFDNRFATFGNTYFSVTKDAIVFCNNTDVMKLWLEKTENNECLNKDATFKNVTGSLTATGGDLIYINPQRAELLFGGLMKDNSKLPAYLSSFSGIVIASGFDEELTNTSAVLKTTGQEKALTGLLWKTKLQNLSDYAPQLVTNVNTGEKEIFTQDTAGNVYLLNKAGEIIFTRNIGERIISGTYQLDYYNNGKLQYVFNTENHVYLMDRLGNDVASYPLKLSYPATAGITLLYDSVTKQYSYYIPCSNNAIYGYESSGRPLAGWSPRQGTGTYSMALQSINFNKTNYLLGFNDDQKLSLFDRKGNTKWSVSNLPDMPQDFSVVKLKNDVLCLNASGMQLEEIAWDGNDQIKPLVDAANSFVATSNSDSTYHYFFSTINSIRQYDGEGTFKGSVGLKDATLSNIKLVDIQGVKYISAKDESKERILLYDMDLQPVGTISIKNTTQFALYDLFDRGQVILLGCDSAGNIYCSRAE